MEEKRNFKKKSIPSQLNKSQVKTYSFIGAGGMAGGERPLQSSFVGAAYHPPWKWRPFVGADEGVNRSYKWIFRGGSIATVHYLHL